MATTSAHVYESAAFTRLGNMATLDSADCAVVRNAERESRRVPARREIVGRGEAFAAPLVILHGWACSFRSLPDGRRQILDLRLPGDLLGVGPGAGTIAAYPIVALTDVAVATLPPRAAMPPSSTLAQVYATSAAIDEFHLLRSVMRLGRLTAYERLADLLLELCDRLQLAGMVTRNAFPMPLTQDTMADALGLTSVHINRTLQTMRRDGVLGLSRGRATLYEPSRLAALADHDRSWLAKFIPTTLPVPSIK